mgnify:CR=1 FL=1
MARARTPEEIYYEKEAAAWKVYDAAVAEAKKIRYETEVAAAKLYYKTLDAAKEVRREAMDLA